MYEIIFYTTAQGDCPVREFLEELDAKPRTKILRFFDHLEQMGPDLPRPYADTLRDKIRELRVPYGRLQWRILYFFEGKRIVLTQGFLKKTQAVPEEEIERALRRMKDWLERGGD
ncbi:MAG: type II toxin-antitoxin system RelE/ParE family toxin [Elusimicrobia bacterium]|nr:type II toxin-antitoxin system RelE/ParE family toxin [Elusimicrobiota bacterium]